ncbi:MAG: S41 family peptidase, partial [Anaerolineales bacterium]|nr:S41 family peptidase [Anaerolineales bacterium]
NQSVSILQNHALDEIPPAPALEYGMIRGMLKAYGDPHTTFVEPIQHELESNRLAGNFGGIGVKVAYHDEGIIILFPYPDSPAHLAGIQDGDRLLMVDGFKIENHTPLDEVKAAIRGPEGEIVKITTSRDQDLTPIGYEIIRESIPIPSVTWHLQPQEPHVGIIEINIISANTPNEIKDAVEDLQSRGATHFVMDLRRNSGGLLSAGIDTARLFIKKGVILKELTRYQDEETFSASSDGPLIDIPLVVLVNHGTASAAEIIAGVLQARERALIIGEPTYGKDSIQLVFNLEDGSSIHITSARWWIPSLEPPIKDHGIQPDIMIDNDNTGPDPAVESAIEFFLGQE